MQARAALAQQQANEHQAELNLSYTTITAPFDGTVGVRTLLTHVRAGQPVTINVDTFDGTVVRSF